jgi:hypothetical protein
MHFSILPSNSGSLDLHAVSISGERGVGVGEVEPHSLSIRIIFEAEDIVALQRKGLMNMREAKSGLALRNSEDVGTVGVVLIFGDVIVDEGHFLACHDYIF